MRRVALALFAGMLAAVADATVTVRERGATLAGLGLDLQPGDVLLAWQSADGSWHDGKDALGWWQLELAQAPLGPLPLRLQRAGQPREVHLPGGRWDWQLQDSVATSPRGRAWQALTAAASAAAACRLSLCRQCLRAGAVSGDASAAARRAGGR